MPGRAPGAQGAEPGPGVDPAPSATARGLAREGPGRRPLPKPEEAAGTG